MSEQHTIYPNLSWAQFEMFNDNTTDAFEEMCKDLFICEYLKDSNNPHKEQDDFLKILEKADIPYVVLKGTAAAMYYPNPFLRGMGDVDVYIPECFHEKVRELLLKEEYEIEEDNVPSNRHSTFSKNNIVFEVHRSFATVNGPEEKAYIDGFLEEYCRDVTKAARIEQVLIWR